MAAGILLAARVSARRAIPQLALLERRLKLIKAAAGGVGRVGRLLGYGLIAAGVAAAYSVKKFADYEHTLIAVGAVTKNTDEEMKQIGKTIRKVARDSTFTLIDLSTAVLALAKAGEGSADDIAAMLPHIDAFAKACRVEATPAAITLLAAIKGFGLEAKDASELASALTAAVVGSALEFEDLRSALQYAASASRMVNHDFHETIAIMMALKDAGVRAAMGGRMYRRMMIEVLIQQPRLQKALKGMGLGMKELDEILKGPEGLIDLLYRLGEAGVSAADLIKIFGGRAGPLSIILTKLARDFGENIDSLDKYLEKTKELNVHFRVSEEMAKSLKSHWLRMAGSLTTLVVAIGGVLTGKAGLKDKFEVVNQMFADLAEAIERAGNLEPLWKALEKAGPALGRLLEKALPAITAAIVKMIPPIIEAIVKSFAPSLVKGIAFGVTDIVADPIRAGLGIANMPQPAFGGNIAPFIGEGIGSSGWDARPLQADDWKLEENAQAIIDNRIQYVYPQGGGMARDPFRPPWLPDWLGGPMPQHVPLRSQR